MLTMQTAAGAALTLMLVLLAFSRMTRVQRVKSVVGGLMIVNLILVLAGGALVLTGGPLFAQETSSGESGAGSGGGGGGLKAMAAAVSVGLAVIAAGIAVAATGAAAIGGMAQNPDIFGRSLVFVGLAEGIAIYGLIISFMILMGFGG